MPQRLMPRHATASSKIRRILSSNQLIGDDITMLHPGKSSLRYFLIFTDYVENFGPKPFGRINSSFILGIVHPSPASGQLVDLRGFLYGGMVFPKDEHGVWVFCKFRI